MFICNNYNLLTFTYYLKYLLAINMTIVPLIYIFILIIKMIKQMKKKIKVTKYFFIDRFKSSFLILTIFILSFIIHNMLKTNNNVCYTYANTKTYYSYKETYKKAKNMNLDNDTIIEYLDNVLLDNEVNDIDIIDNNNDNYLNETDTNKQNNICVVNGIFYYPKYIYGNKNTYSGINCPSNPSNKGYNNPYGYNNYFYNRLNKFIEDASKNGYKITISTQGCRSYSTQVNYYNTMTPGRAASPGLSLHGFGIASDLEFYQSNGYICPSNRNDNSCPSMGWAHKNAEKYGLTFPLLNASYKEDWHIEPINKEKY